MKASVFSLVLFAAASLVSAQQGLSNLPKCVLTCVQPYLSGTNKQFNCGMTDIGCFCNNPDFISAVSICICSSCSADEVKQAGAFASTICGKAGASLNTNVCTATPSVSGAIASATPNTTTGQPHYTTTTTKPTPTGAANALAASGIGMVGGAIAAILFL